LELLEALDAETRGPQDRVGRLLGPGVDGGLARSLGREAQERARDGSLAVRSRCSASTRSTGSWTRYAAAQSDLTSESQGNTRVVVAGGGVAALEAVLALRALAGDSVSMTMLAPDEHFVYQPMSVQEPFALGPAKHYPLARVAEDVGLDLRRGALASVDPGGRSVTTSEGQTLSYDALLVAVGAGREPAYEHVLTFRGEEDAERAHGLVQDIEAGYVKRVAFVVPPGHAWSLPLYEIALMTARRARETSAGIELTVVTPEESPLEVFGAQASEEVARLLADAGIAVETGAHATVERSGEVLLRPGGRHLTCDRIVALPRIVGLLAGDPALLDRERLRADRRARARAGPRGRVGRGRRHGVPGQAGRDRLPAGRRGRRGHSAARGRGRGGRAVPPGPARAAPHGRHAALHGPQPGGRPRRRFRGLVRDALVAAEQDLRRLPGALPRRASGGPARARTGGPAGRAAHGRRGRRPDLDLTAAPDPFAARRSPDGRIEVRFSAWEARMSHWILEPAVVRLRDGAEVLSFEGSAWDAGGVMPTFPAPDRVELHLRHYPDGATIHDLVDVESGRCWLAGDEDGARPAREARAMVDEARRDRRRRQK
jgi:DNA-directed RNA polymerase subunit K/omega